MSPSMLGAANNCSYRAVAMPCRMKNSEPSCSTRSSPPPVVPPLIMSMLTEADGGRQCRREPLSPPAPPAPPVAPSAAENGVARFLAGDQRRGVGVAGGDGREDRGIGDPQPGDAVHPERRVDDAAGRIRSHAATADRMEHRHPMEIGRASCRERGCQYVSISVVAV